jgi:hypothetical protein
MQDLLRRRDYLAQRRPATLRFPGAVLCDHVTVPGCREGLLGGGGSMAAVALRLLVVEDDDSIRPT